jgi:uracil-DNA glycosylase family 4
MIDARQAAYLQALGVDVYVPRGHTPLAIPRGDTPLAIPRDASQPAFEPELPSFDVAAEPEPAPPAGASRPASPARAPARPQSGTIVDRALMPSGPVIEPAAVDDFDWERLQAVVAACQRCELHASRTQTVFGVGNRQARWMFIGEAPGQEEDRQGEPFVGRAGQLLNAMIRSLGMRREDVYIANVLKCRPPGNRDPKPAEAASCRAYLERQVALVDPTVVIAVGRVAAQDLLMTETPIAKLRGKVHSFGARSWPLVVTYHPAYLLRSPGEKRKAWQDLLFARQLYTRLAREAAGAGHRA